MVTKTYELPELWAKEIKSKLLKKEQLKEFRKFLEFNLKANWTKVGDLQKSLNKVLTKKWYKAITEDNIPWSQVFEAIRIFENEYKWKNIQNVKYLKNTDIANVIVLNAEKLLKQEQDKQDKKQQQRFGKVTQKAPKEEVEKAEQELEQVDQDKHIETTKVVKATQVELKNHEKTIVKSIDNEKIVLNIKKMETIFVKNNSWELIPVNFAKWFKDKFNITSEKKGDINFGSKDSLIPFGFNVNVNAKPKKDKHWHKIGYEWYNFNLNLPKKEGVNFYEKKVSWDKNMNQVYYSFKKDGKVYLWVVWFKFDSGNWSITDFRTTEKELKNINSPMTEDELSNYESKVYDSWILDFAWYTIKEWTTISNINHMDVGTAEETYEELKKKYKNERSLNWALQFLWSEIATNSTLRNNFPIWWVDKEWVNTWDILWVVITSDGLEKSWLDNQLKLLYKMIDKWTLTDPEFKQVSQDIAKYPNIDKADYKDKIQWLSDQNDSWIIWDMTDTIIWEKTVFELMKNLWEEKWNKKVDEILNLAGCPEELKGTYFAKPYFYRWLERLNLYPLWLKKYLSWKMTLKEVEENNIELKKKSRHDMLVSFLGSKEEAQQLEDKMKWKYEQLKLELENRLPDEHKNDPSIFERLKASIEYTGMSAAYIDHTRKADNVWWAVNFSTDWGIIDSLSLWLVTVGGQLVPWIAVGKSFAKKFNDARTSVWVWWNLVNFVFPLLSVSASHDFSDDWLKKWDSSSKKIVTSVWTAFPILFGTLWYNFGKAGQIEYKEAKLYRVLNGMFAKLNNWEKLEETYYTDKYEKEIVRSINAMIKTAKLNDLSSEERKEVYKTMKEWIQKNFSHLLWKENEWTRLSEVGIIWAVIPLVYGKMESIKVNYNLDKNAYKNLSDSFDDIKKNWKLESIKNINELKKTLEVILWVGSVEIRDGRVFIDLNKIQKWTLITFGDGIQTKKVWFKLEIWWLLTWKLFSSQVSKPWKHMNVVWIWQGSLSTWYNKDWSSHTDMKNSIAKDKDGKLDLSWFTPVDNVSKLVVEQGNEKLLNKEYIQAKEKFKKSELYRLLDNSVDGWIFVSNYKGAFSKQYAKLVGTIKDYNYSDAVTYISDTILAKRSPLSWYVYHTWGGQKVLDKIRTEVKKIKNSWDDIQKQVFVEKFVNNLFLDEHIKIKQDYTKIKSNIEEWCKKLWIEINKTKKEYVLSKDIMKKIKEQNITIDNKPIKNNNFEFWSELALETVINKLWYKKLANEFHKWYTARMSMKEFDTIDWAAQTAYNRTAWFLRSVRNELLHGQNTLNGHLAITGSKWVEKVEKEAKQILSDHKPEWFNKLSKEKQNKLIAFAQILLAGEDYISKPQFEKETNYKNVSVSNIVAFPFTYKISVDTEHGHVPMYGTTDLVDVNGDGKFDKNDYTEIDSEQVNKYLYSMLGDNFKNSLRKIIKKNKWIKKDLTEEQLEELFVKKTLTIDWKTINLSYKTIYTKWWECFNSTLALKDLQLDGAGVWVSAVSGNVYFTNKPKTDINTYLFGTGGNKDSNSNNWGNNWGVGAPWNSNWWSWNAWNWNPAWGW